MAGGCLDVSLRGQCSQPSSPSVFGVGLGGLRLTVRLFGALGRTTWRFIKYSDELVPRFGHLGVCCDILAPNHPNTL